MEQTPVSTLIYRRGVALPLVLGGLIILSLLIFAIVSSSSNSYILNALVNHNNHARMIVNAVTEEATLWLHEELANPLKISSLREELLFSVIKAQEYNLDLTGKLHTLDILYADKGGDLYGTPDPGGAQAGVRVVDFDKVDAIGKYKAQIEFVKVRFHSFVPLRYHQSDLYTNPQAYYRDFFGFGGIPPVGDFVGFYTVHTKVKFGSITREHMVSRDFKIINNAPVGGAYALFLTDVPSGSRQQSELNSGGKVTVNARNKGRVFVQGPLFLDVEGEPDGTQGSGPNGLGYPMGGGAWTDFSFVPPPRALTTCSFFSSKIERPKKASGFGLMLGLGTAGCMGFNLTGDPAIQAMPDVQNYWAASAAKGKQTFTITNRDSAFRLFKGHAYKVGDKTPLMPFEGDINLLEDNMQVRPEGALIGNFHQINFQKMKSGCFSMTSIFSFASGLFGGGGAAASGAGAAASSSSGAGLGAMKAVGDMIQLCTYLFRSSHSGKIAAPYGLGKYSAQIDRMEMLAGAISDGLQALSASGNTNSGNNPLSVFGRGLSQAAQGAGNAATRQNQLKGGLGANDIMPVPAILPSNFKPFMRTAARKFPSLESYFKSQGKGANAGEILLDGNLWVDELVMKAPLTYRGTGTIASAYIPNSNIFKATADTPEVMALQRGDPMRDHLNIFYINAENPESGKGMIKLKGDIFQASFYSYQGVKPEGTVVIEGNLVANVLNKPMIPESSHLNISFDDKVFLQEDKRSQVPLRWYTISISPKLSGMSMTMANRIGGPGDDGVRVFLDSLDSVGKAPATSLP